MACLVSHAQLARVTSLIQHLHSSPKVLCAFTHLRQCSITPNPETTVVPESPSHPNLKKKIEEKLNAKYRKLVPEEMLSDNVVTLTCQSSSESGVCDVYLVGTKHLSQESCKVIINFLKPQAVFLELCPSRMFMLESNPRNPEAIIRGKVFTGSEFGVAYEEAIKYSGRAVLGDRPIQITERRAWAKMQLLHKTKL